MPEPKPRFIKADPAATDPATHIQVQTEENPGAIQPGHILIYNEYDGKLETTQPEDTHFTKRVHPLTVRPAQGPSAKTVAQDPDQQWLVIARTASELTLGPWPQIGMYGCR